MSVSRAVTLLVLVVGCEELIAPHRPVATIELATLGDVWVGDIHTLQAAARDADGTRLLDRPMTWSTSNTTIAEVDAMGVLTAHAVGAVTIAVTCEGKRAEISVVVADLDLIYEAFSGGVSEMLVLSLEGGAPTRVLPAGAHVSSPAPSPDGSRIAFVAATAEQPYGDIYVVNRDGTGLQQLTFSPELDENPSWSPDGTKIAFRSFRDGRLGDIWVMNADGSNPVNLTPDPLPGVTDERRPAWSPDGEFIAFASTRGGTLDIWTMRTNGSDLFQVTNHPDYDTEPTWSPTGTQIAFRRSDDDISDLYVVGVRGGTPLRLAVPGHELMPAWSPNGRIIAYAHFHPNGSNPQIYTVRPDGSDRTLRTTDPQWEGAIEPSWIRK